MSVVAVSWPEAAIWIAVALGSFGLVITIMRRGAPRAGDLIPRHLQEKFAVMGNGDDRVVEELELLRAEIAGLREQVAGMERVLKEVG